MPTDYFLAFNGYGYFSEGVQPQLSRHAMISSDYIYTPEGVAIDIPFYTEDDIEIVYTRNSVQTTIDTLNDWDNDSSNAVRYVSFTPNTDNTPYNILVYNDGQTSLLKTITLTPICEPKYSYVKCQFLNRYGVLEQMYFFKRSDEDLTITDETFKRNTITSSATYDTKKHQNQRFNVQAKTSITLNTDYVNEDANKTIEELFLSEFVWLNWEGNDLPATPVGKQLRYKTGLNDKLINYSIKFDFAFDKINSVR